MPMRFRSVVPYTMPGVLVLIGWWWYTSRKKEQLIDQNSEVSPSPVSFKDSHVESSNGLLYEDESPISSNLSNQNTENEIISPIHLQDTEAISSQEHKFEVPFCVLEEVDAPSNLFPPKFGNKDLGEKSTKPLKDPETDSSSVFIGNLEKCPPKELDLFSENLVEDAALQSNACKDTTFSDIAIHLSDAERPEPEGEVATHHSAVNAQEEIVSIFRSAKTHRMMISDEDSLENPLSVQDSDKKMLTGASTILSKAQGTTSADMHFKRNTQEMNDLELLAAGLISEVLSAATKEVLGITNCEVTPNDKPSDESNSACSTYHSEEGISSENLQSSLLENPADFFKVKDLSAKEAIQHQSVVGSITKETEENSYAMRNVKRVNGSDLRNGAHGTCELDTDQSGGSDVNSMDSVDSGCTMGVCENQGSNTASSTSELIIWEIEVPKHLVGRLIGKQGRYVSFLKQNSGAKIYISTLPYTQEFQICHIEGLQQQVDKALSFIGKKFKDLDLTNLYAPPLTLPSLPITSWLLLPSGVTVEVIVVNIVSAGHIFVQQHTHPTYHALRSLDQQMFLCYSQPGTPALPSPAEVGVICAAPAVDGAWWRAQVITFYKETEEVEIRYVDYGGYDKVKIDSLRQIRSDFVTLPFQGAEVLLDNITPLPGLCSSVLQLLLQLLVNVKSFRFLFVFFLRDSALKMFKWLLQRCS
uniref:A kinase (PRKA) anchor protein 1b n=1 Tax=Fundulus heteroclitus TaxID=8078 RepID=A0A3Q2PWM8_FUNHE